MFTILTIQWHVLHHSSDRSFHRTLELNCSIQLQQPFAF